VVLTVIDLRSILTLFFLASTVALTAQDWQREDLIIYETFDEMAPILHPEDDTTYLINFWATWCGPCVKELPYFEEINETYAGRPFKTVLISLDMEKKIDSKLLPFLNKNDIKSEVVLLLDGKAHKWIDKVDPSWSGAIPITIVRRGESYAFYEKEFHSEQELIDIVSPILDPK